MKKIIPIRFDGYMQSGGSTKPWRVVAITAEEGSFEEGAYVVKTFTPAQNGQAHSIAKEFIGNALAGQFDLNVPEAFVVDLHDEDFKSTLSDEMLKVLSLKHQGNTFATGLLTNATIINEEVRSSSFGITECATLFAFDCLVVNIDRGGYRNKPNLLVDDEGFYLIDHELSFPFIDGDNGESMNGLLEKLNSNTWPNFYQRHLFYARLKTFKGSKKNLFDTFEELLKNLDVNNVRQLINDMADYGILRGQSDLLITYLSILKQNAAKFRNILLGIIS